jgi:hypothetical protein
LAVNGGRMRTHGKSHAIRLGLGFDYFFMVDGDLTMYLIPSRVIAGCVSILLRTYARYVVGNASGLLGADGAQGCSR